MITKLGNQFYQLTPTDGFGVRVTASGPAFFVPASIDVTAINLQDGVVFPIPPTMLSGAGSHHQLNIHCFFNPPSGSYTIEILSDTGFVVDTIPAQIPSNQPAGTQMSFQSILLVA